jgi:hypothetical protein
MIGAESRGTHQSTMKSKLTSQSCLGSGFCALHIKRLAAGISADFGVPSAAWRPC